MPRRAFFVVGLVVALVLAHFTLRPMLQWRAGVDFMLVAALVAAVRVRPGHAAICGFVLGVFADSLTPEAFGAGALALSLVAFAGSHLKHAFFAENLALNAIFVFVGKLAFDVIFLVAERRLSGAALAWQLLLWTPLAALVTAAVGLLVMTLARPAEDRRRP